MNIYRIISTLTVLLSLLATGCAPSIQQIIQTKNIESTSKSAFDKVEPLLKDLKPGDDLQSKIKWRLFEIQGQDKGNGIANADGWIGHLSGDYYGGLFGFGHIISRSENKLFGEHVFGYLVFGTTLVPRYSVITQAELIPYTEYKNLAEKKAVNWGLLPTPGWSEHEPQDKDIPQLTFYRDVTVKEVRMLDYHIKDADISDSSVKVEKIGTLKDLAKLFLTPDRFHEAEIKLREIEKGTDAWEVIKKLNGKYFTPNSGINYFLLMDGYIMDPWHKMTPDGLFVVWPFGYLEGEISIPKSSLIFKNDKVYKIVPYASKKETEEYFH
jgi:hypothetical protein